MLKSNSFWRVGVVAAVLLSFATLTPRGAHAATFVVTNTSSHNDVCSASSCSLSEAMTAAEKTPTADTITFAPGVRGTIDVGLYALPSIEHNLSIIGPTSTRLTIDGGGLTYLMEVNKKATLVLSHLTLANGKSRDVGGALRNFGTLLVNDCTFSGNSAFLGGALNNSGTATINECLFLGNEAEFSGGAIDNVGVVNLQRCTFVQNQCGHNGGAIVNSGALYGLGTLNVEASTFSNNRAGRGGAIYIDEGHLQMNGTIIADNQATVVGPNVYFYAEKQ